MKKANKPPSERKAKETPTVSFRCSHEELAQITEVAKGSGVSPGVFVRQLVLDTISGASSQPSASPAERDGAISSPSSDDLERMLRRAVWALIVALSPEMDEEDAERFCAEVFDA